MGCVGSEEKHRKIETSIQNKDEFRSTKTVKDERKGQGIELQIHEVSFKHALKDKE